MSALHQAIEYSALGWVKPELDETLRLARMEIEGFVDDPSDTSRMRVCAGFLHQVQGTLRMVELYAPAMVAEEMERLSEALEQGRVDDLEGACSALLRGVVLLPDYLERLQSGHKEISIVLLPVLNELRAARGEIGLNESVLFNPDLDRVLPASLPQVAALPASARAAEVTPFLVRLREALQTWPEEGAPADTDGLHFAVESLLARTPEEPQRRMLWVASMVATALHDKALAANAGLRQAFSSVEREARRPFENDGFGTPRADGTLEPTRQLLYHVSHSDSAHPALVKLRDVFDLDALKPTESELDHARGSVAGRNRALLDTVSAAVKEDLLRVKDALDLYLRTGRSDPDSLKPQVDALTRVSDTLGMLGLGLARSLVQQQRDEMAEIVDGRRAADEGALLEIAGALLYVDASLDAQVERLASGDDSGDSEDLSASEARKVLDVLLREAITNFAAARQAFVAFVETAWNHQELEPVPKLLEDVSGALRILELPQPASYLDAARAYTETELLGRRRIPNSRQLDTVADALASIEYYLEALGEHRANRDDILDIARNSLEALGYWPIPARDMAGAQAGQAAPIDLQAAAMADAAVREAQAQAAAERAAEERAARERADTERREAAERAAQERAEAERAELERAEAERAEAERAEAERMAVQRAQQERDEAERAEAARLEAERLEAARLEAERLEAERLEAQRLESERADMHRLDMERAEAERVEAERLEAERLEAERLEAERLALVQAEAERAQAARAEAERLEAERLEAERLEAERAEAARLAAEREAQAHAAALAEQEAEAAMRALAAAAPAAMPVLPVASGFDATSDDIDDEIREIFLEEFGEEISNLGELLPAWRAEPENLERMYPVRRVFHTLKGSGRLVGAKVLGEFSWKIENMLNRVRDGLRGPSPAVLSMTELAAGVLPQLHGALSGGGAVTANLAGIEALAERIADGEEIMPGADLLSAPAAAPAAHVEDRAATAPAASASGVAFSVDPLLLDILQAEVGGHLLRIDQWLAVARVSPAPADDGLVRAIHTMNGAFAMTEVPSITDALTPAEAYVRRLLLSGAVADAAGVEAIADLAARVRTTLDALSSPGVMVPDCSVLTARLVALRDSLPDLKPQMPLEPEAIDVRTGDDALQALELTDLDMSAFAGFDGVAIPVQETPASSGRTAAGLDLIDLDGGAEIDLSRMLAESMSDAGNAPLAVQEEDSFTQAAERFEAERVEAERVEAERLEAERLEAERAEAERLEAERLEAERLEAERLEAERVEAERLEAERLEAERAEAERLEAERLEAERLEAERLEAERAEAERLESERLEAERLAASAAEREAAERAELDRLEAALLESERADAERLAELEAQRLAEARQPVVDDIVVDEVHDEVPAERVDAVDSDALFADSAQMQAPEVELPAFFDMSELPPPAAEVQAPAAEPLLAFNEDPDAPLDLSELDEELVEIFVEEAQDLLDHSDKLLVRLREMGEDRESVVGLQRDLHTLKGGARMAGIMPVGELGHTMESLLEAVAEQRTSLGGGDVPLLERGFDRLHAMVTRVGAGRAVGMPSALIAEFEARVEGRVYVPAPVVQPEPQPDALVAPAADQLAVEADALESHAFELHASERHASEPRAVELDIVREPAADAPAFADEIASHTGEAIADGVSDAGTADVLPADVLEPETASADAIVPSKPVDVARPSALAPLSAPVETAQPFDDDVALRGNQEQVRVRADLLDRLVNYAGEVAIYRSRLEQQLGAFRAATAEMEQTNIRLRDQLRRLEIETEAQIIARYQREGEVRDDNFDPLELDRFSTVQQLSRALAETATDLTSLQSTLEDLTQQYETLLLQQSRVSSELQEGLMRTRMLPFDTVVPRLRRVLRQAASETGKQVQLKLDGAQGELDRNVLERMTAPLEHMLRNSVAHGFEKPDQRVALGKTAEGTVRIAIRKEGSEVVLQISDDGRGLDRDAIRERAIARGLLRADALVSSAQLDAMILQPGFSTASEVSRLAGRGVGMDVVASEVRQLGGTLDIQSDKGVGTTFTLRLPQTLAVTQAAFVRIGETMFAVPIASVRGVGRIPREELDRDGLTYRYGSDEYVLHDLGKLIGQAPAKAEGQLQMPVLLTRSGDLHAAVTVDQIVGNREIVVKPIGPQVASIPGIFGATVMGDGSVVVILDVAPLVRRQAAIAAEQAELAALGEAAPEAQAPAEARAVPLVMVVDDSITMRKVTGRVLERNNFEVMTAKDGLDALERMADRVPDLMLLDIEMPRMDGYELATAMKAEPRLAKVPIIMITSRTGDKHRQRALDIGVDRYLGKPYQENELMRNVFALLESVQAHG